MATPALQDSRDLGPSWTRARSAAKLIGPTPPILQDTIPVLWNNHLCNLRDGNDSVYNESIVAAAKLEKSAKLRAPLYFAGFTLFPEQFRQCRQENASQALLEVLRPGLLATLVSMVYFHRRVNRLCERPEWKDLAKQMVFNMELGYIIGDCFPAVGQALGLLLGGVRIVSLAPFLMLDPKNFNKYQSGKNVKLDIEFEQNRWGCDHEQIAAFVLANVGFGGNYAEMCFALRRDEEYARILRPELKMWSTIIKLIEAARRKNFPPTKLEKAELLLGDKSSKIEECRRRIEQVHTHGSSFDWFFKSSKDPLPDELDAVSLEAGEIAEEEEES